MLQRLCQVVRWLYRGDPYPINTLHENTTRGHGKQKSSTYVNPYVGARPMTLWWPLAMHTRTQALTLVKLTISEGTCVAKLYGSFACSVIILQESGL